MLLRSASTPVLNSWIPHSNPKESPTELDFVHQIPRTRSVALSASCSSPMSVFSSDHSTKRMNRTLSETDLRDLSSKRTSRFLNGGPFEEREESGIGFGLLKKTSLDCGLGLDVALDEECEVLVGGGSGKIGGGSDGSDRDGGWDSWDSNHGNDRTDVYYQKMIEANPENGLLLSNYARFLKEVRADFVKAEEYCGRAILANPNDASVLSMYADLVWRSHKDASRAETYFDQAVKAAPDDCYVLASYAHFLWDAEEEDEEEKNASQASLPNFLHGPPPVAAASHVS